MLNRAGIAMAVAALAGRADDLLGNPNVSRPFLGG